MPPAAPATPAETADFDGQEAEYHSNRAVNNRHEDTHEEGQRKVLVGTDEFSVADDVEYRRPDVGPYRETGERKHRHFGNGEYATDVQRTEQIARLLRAESRGNHDAGQHDGSGGDYGVQEQFDGNLHGVTYGNNLCVIERVALT